MKKKKESNWVMREWKVIYWTKEDNPAIPDIESLRFKPEKGESPIHIDDLTFVQKDKEKTP